MVAERESGSPAWIATGPCGVARCSSEERTNFMQIKIVVNELFNVNVTVLRQIMTYVHPDSNTNCVAIASGDWKTEYQKCGTGGTYYHLIEHNIAYIDIRYNEMNDTVFVAFVYQVTDAGAMDNKYFLPEFIALHEDSNLVFSVSEALRYRDRQLFLWIFSSLDVLHVVSVQSSYYTCSGIVVGHDKARLTIWDGEERAFITARGIISDLTMLHSEELCGHKDAKAKFITASGSIGSLTIGLDYQINTAHFRLYMYVFPTLFVCTPPICIRTKTALPMLHPPSEHERFSIVLETTSQVYIHSLNSISDGEFPVLTVEDIRFESTVPFNTSTCRLGSLHINVPGYIKIMTFCSGIQLQFLLNSVRFGGIHFTRTAYFIIKNNGRFGRIAVNDTLSLSHCEGIINICDKVPAPTNAYTYGHVDIKGVGITRKRNSCIVIYNLPSDALYKAIKCDFLASSTDLYDRSNLTLRLSETIQEGKHRSCKSSVAVLISPQRYVSIEFWYHFALFSNCPAMGSYIQFYLQDAPSACDAI